MNHDFDSPEEIMEHFRACHQPSLPAFQFNSNFGDIPTPNSLCQEAIPASARQLESATFSVETHRNAISVSRSSFLVAMRRSELVFFFQNYSN